MQIVRTIFWVFILVALLVFTAFNWEPVEVRLWENMIVETKVPALVIVAFLLGVVPAWLIHRATKFRLQRRIGQLEGAARMAASNRQTPPAPSTSAGTSTAPDAVNPVDPEPEAKS